MAMLKICELYDLYRDEVDLLQEPAHLFLLAFVVSWGGLRLDEIEAEMRFEGREVNSMVEDLIAKRMLHSQDGRFYATAAARELVARLDLKDDSSFRTIVWFDEEPSYFSLYEPLFHREGFRLEARSERPTRQEMVRLRDTLRDEAAVIITDLLFSSREPIFRIAERKGCIDYLVNLRKIWEGVPIIVFFSADRSYEKVLRPLELEHVYFEQKWRTEKRTFFNSVARIALSKTGSSSPDLGV